MAYETILSEDYKLVRFNHYKSVMHFTGEIQGDGNENVQKGIENVEFIEDHDSTKILIDLPVKAHILGLGAKAFPVDRKRKRFVMFNRDPNTYREEEDPIYSSIPFFTTLHETRAWGYFIDYPGKIIMDFGVEIYNKIKITIYSNKFDMYIFRGKTPTEILTEYLRLTGNPVLIPKWATGHSISRYSYYPETVALEVVQEYMKLVPVDSLFLDIHHMEDNKIFTWDRNRFKNPERFIEDLHKKGVKVIPIVDPSIKIDQNYGVFERLNGTYMETEKNEIYSGQMWPGLSAFPDFFNSETRRKWGKEVKRWMQYGFDGIWLDMNEPTVLQDDKIIDGSSIHRCDDGIIRQHKDIRNAYPTFEAMGTYEALREIDREPFILTRAGYSGIQRYAAMWTGDNISSEDDLYLQMSMVPSLSISGVTSCGCDLGGFFHNGNPELLDDYYRMALFFPLYRNHKDIAGNDQEIFMQPPRIRDRIVSSVQMRYKFIDHIYQCLYFSHKYLKPTVAPISFYYWKDPTAIHLKDQYMLGDNLIYAPRIGGRRIREVYLPEGRWIRFSNNQCISGPSYVEADDDFPIFIRENSVIIFDGRIIIYGKGTFKVYHGEEAEISDKDAKKVVELGGKTFNIEAIKIDS